MSDFIGWALERWPFGVTVTLALGFLFGGLAFEWGPPIIRPASAQSVQQRIATAKGEMTSQIAGIQSQLTTISNAQATLQKQASEDRIDRLEQQLLWWRQQNCKSKGQARNYAWSKMDDLKSAYRKITGTDWQMPTCGDIGD